MEPDVSRPLVTAQSKVELEQQFILTWKSFPALWDSGNPYYTNKYKRLDCLEKLLDIYKKIKPGATTDDVRKKINIFRSNFKRELNKVSESVKRGSGDVYSPRVWYFPLLNFLVESKPSVKLPQQSLDSADEYVDTSREVEQYNIDIKEEFDTDDSNDDENGMIKEEVYEDDICDDHGRVHKRQKYDDQDIQNSRPDTWPMNVYKYNPLAVIWSEKLERLCPMQKLYAEKAINDILFEAELGNLTKCSVQINSQTGSKSLT